MRIISVLDLAASGVNRFAATGARTSGFLTETRGGGGG